MRRSGTRAAQALVAAAALLTPAFVERPAVARDGGADLALGRRVYDANCAICHGPDGDGRGHAAHHFQSAPRDLTAGQYKVRSTPSGQVPTDDDLRRSIVAGLPGTGMVPQDHLSDAEVGAVVAHIKTLSSKFAGPPPSPLRLPPEPARPADAVARGRRVYDRGECAECHGKEGRGDGPSAKDLKVKPADLHRRPFKTGDSRRDIVRTLLTGMDGTPMPSYHLVIDDDDLWALAWYVESLAGPPVVTPDERAGWHVVGHHQQRPRGSR
jgi:cytochrome c oxidase cbb3-type subunit 2